MLRRSKARVANSLEPQQLLPEQRPLPASLSAQVEGNSTLKLALIGCGGRGSGAANQNLTTEGTKLVAAADVFEGRMDSTLEMLTNRHKDKVEVPQENKFIGFDAYLKAIEVADIVILATPPGFRPMMFEAAIDAGKHVFMEKPVCVDAPGYRKVMAAAKKADEKNPQGRRRFAATLSKELSRDPGSRQEWHDWGYRQCADLVEWCRCLGA